MSTSVSNDVFQKFKHAQKLPRRQDGDGRVVEVLEDEDQSVKLEEIIDLLVAAGYFRARIKGLSPFDKVVGGMTWCIESCDMDVDVDLLFQENSTIGQKIALTEKIVALLPKMKCPHSIEPHQIQGMDFIHIFPVIQWLVKRSMEFRQEKSVFVRAFAVNQFTKEFEVVGVETGKQKQVLENINTVREVYRPHRYYKRKTAPPSDINSRVQITLLEYGDKPFGNIAEGPSKPQNLDELLTNLTTTTDEQIVDLNEEDKLNLQRHYATLQMELRDGGAKAREETELKTLENQKLFLDETYKKLEEKQSEIQGELNETRKVLQEIQSKHKETQKNLQKLEQEEATRTSSANLEEVEALIRLNDSLNLQESQFREQCKKELARLQNKIKEAKEKPKNIVEDDGELAKKISEEVEAVRVLRLKLAKKNRVVAGLQRHLDEIPNRAELAQYQRRFLELYNQMAAKHKETKQYYTLYNTLEDTKLYMKKELSLLESISENYPEVMRNPSGKDEFLQQFKNIVEGVRQSRLKVEQKLQQEKRKRDEHSRVLQGLVDMQRKYVNTVSQLSVECKKHEALMAREQSSGF